MKKTILFIAIVLLTQTISSQKYFTRTGETDFKASVEAFEPVEATNNSTTVILKTDTGDIACQLFMTAFKFKVALMQEHYNENYMDSDKYPKATFRGKLEGFSTDNLSDGKEFPLKGTLTIRGKKKEIETKATVIKKGDKLHITTKFSVQPQDFDIEIPSIVRKKIAEKINVNVNYELSEKK